MVVHHRESGRTDLRFSTTVSDVGSGPLEVAVDPALVDCDHDGAIDDHVARQRVFEDANSDGIFEPTTDTGYADHPAGCKTYHPHRHRWQFMDSASFVLRSEATGEEKSARKASYCLLDTLDLYPALPGSPAGGAYHGYCGELDTQGVSVGWGDVYPALFPGQRLDVTGLKRGRYCLTVTADPDNQLVESDDSDNARSLKIRLIPRRRTVEPLSGPCGG